MSREQADQLINQSYANYRRQIEDLQRKAQWDLKSIWEDTYSFPTEQDRVEEAQRIIQKYGDRGAQIGRNYYQQVRTATAAAYDIDLPPYEAPRFPDRNDLIWQLSGGTNNTDVPGLHLGDVIPDANGAVHNKAGIRIDDLWPSGDKVGDYLDYVNKWIHSAGRMQVKANITADPTKPRWARVPKGATCEFCMMLASRGFDYHSEQTASLGGSFHNGACDCMIVPNWANQKIKGYNPELLKQRWQACADTVSRLTTQKEYDKYVQAFVPDERHPKPFPYSHWKRNIELSEARWRNRTWLNGGAAPSIDARPPMKLTDIKPHEWRSAERIRESGVSPWFKLDHKNVPKEDGSKGTREIGLSDLVGGVELKTLLHTSSKNTIDSHLKDTAKKIDAQRVIFDNFENNLLHDEDLITLLLKSQRFKRGQIYINSKENKLIRVR